MIFDPKPLLPSATLPPSELKEDKKSAQRYEDCGLGEKALYLGTFALRRNRYLPLDKVERVFKRLAVSKGFFEQGKIYGTLSYLVVLYDGGREKVCRFEHEENLDLMLRDFRLRTTIPVGKPK
jgi:hypothetical protein